MHSRAMCLPREEVSKSKDFIRVPLNREVCLHTSRPHFLFLVCIHPSDSHGSEAPFLASATGWHLVDTSCVESVQPFLSRFRHLHCATFTSFDISLAPTIFDIFQNNRPLTQIGQNQSLKVERLLTLLFKHYIVAFHQGSTTLLARLQLLPLHAPVRPKN